MAPGADRRLFSIGLVLMALTLMPVMDAIAKHLSASFSVWQVSWARYFFHLLPVLPYTIWRYGWRCLWPAQPGLQLARGSTLLLSTICFFGGVAVMPIADTLALAFVSPLVVTALSPLLLGERVSARRYLAVAVGFGGALVIIRPGAGVMQWAALYGIGAGVTYALYLIWTRKLSGTAPALVTLCYAGIVGTVGTTVALPFVWRTPDLAQLGWMVAMGALAAFGHGLITKAYDHAPASLLAPFSYSEMVMAALIGYLWFGDFPDAWTWTGVAVIVASGLYLGLPQRPAHEQRG